MNKDIINDLPLVQKYFGTKESKSVKSLPGSDYWDTIPDDISRNEFLMYLDFPRPKVLLRLRGGKTLSSRVAQFPHIKEVLLQLPELHFDAILFALTLYGTVSNHYPLEVLTNSKTFKSIPLIDDILQPTNGYILYAHQFEQIYSRIPSDSEIEIVTLRKDWNKKKPEAIELVKQTEITPEISFYDLLLERTIEENHFVWNANFKGAKMLWNNLIKD
jgi:hypothetical protein